MAATESLLFALWFFLPAGIANAVPVFAAKLPGLKHWNTPVDMGRSWRGARIFGDHKTWRGVVCGTLAAIVTSFVLWPPTSHFINITLTEWPSLALIGALMGLGALIGDMIKSFFKRRTSIKPGASWFPYDQLDYILGGLLFVTPLGIVNASQYIWIVGTWFLLHVLSVFVGYHLGIREHPI